MRNLLAFFAALLVTFVGLGWYLDWYSFRTTPAPSGQNSITIDIHTKKIAEDALKAEQKIQKKLAEKVNEGDKTPAKTTLSVPSEKKAATTEVNVIGGPLGGSASTDGNISTNSLPYPIVDTKPRTAPNP